MAARFSSSRTLESLLRGRPAAEQFLSVGQLDRAAVCNRTSGLGAESFDLNLEAHWKSVPSPAEPQQGVRGAELKPPRDNRAIWFFNIDVKPRVRIYPVHSCGRTLDLDRFADIEFGRECMVRCHRRTMHSRPNSGKRDVEGHFHRFPPQFVVIGSRVRQTCS